MDDPYKPYKMYIGIFVVFLGTFITQTQGKFPWWVDAILVSLSAALAIYVTPNPKK